MIEPHYDWQIKNVDQPSDEAAHLADSLSIKPMVAQILLNRGYDTKEKAEQFLQPDLSQLHDPMTMHDMQKGIDHV